MNYSESIDGLAILFIVLTTPSDDMCLASYKIIYV